MNRLKMPALREGKTRKTPSAIPGTPSFRPTTSICMPAGLPVQAGRNEGKEEREDVFQRLTYVEDAIVSGVQRTRLRAPVRAPGPQRGAVDGLSGP